MKICRISNGAAFLFAPCFIAAVIALFLPETFTLLLMPLFKSGDVLNDQYASYTTEQLIQIVTDKNNSYLPGEVETARRILLVRGHDYRTKEQKTAEKQLQAINQARQSSNTSAFTQPRVRINRQNRPSGGFAIKGWHWVWIIIIFIRIIGCLVQHAKH